MCLIVDTKIHKRKFLFSRKPKYLIAKEDIKCYKVLLSHNEFIKVYTTPYRCYPVNFVDGRAELKAKIKSPKSIETTICTAYGINEGIHSCCCYTKALCYKKILKPVKIFDAIIPKGTKYYIGVGDEFVSERLIIREKNY